MTALLPAALLVLQSAGGAWQDAPPLPRPVTGGAVAAVETATGTAVVSFLGVSDDLPVDGGEPGRPNQAFRWEVGSAAWRELAPVPGPPRRAATAEAVAGRVYLFGGRTAVDAGGGTGVDGAGSAVGRVDVYDPRTDAWSAGTPMPVPVSDAVSGVWRDSLVYLVGGRGSASGTVTVQLYDPAADRWTEATPAPGGPVSGHAGAVARDAIVYIDGTGSEAWLGAIDPTGPMRVAWRRLPDHPGPPRHRAAAAAVGTRVVFVGGGDLPHADDGTGSDGEPAEPVWGALVFDLVTGAWRRASGPPEPAMDPPGLARAGGWLVLPGGRTSGRAVSGRVWRISVLDLIAGER